MAYVLVDSSVLLDLMTEDPVWGAWSAETIAALAEDNTFVINPIIYAEISVRFETIEELENAVAKAELEHRSLPWEAAFLAGKCHLKYRRRGGSKRAPLPDFYIGAHAAVERMTLLTRDQNRFKTYFPALEVVCPPTP